MKYLAFYKWKQMENEIVHGLWIGKSLSSVELLCIHSYIAQGYEFHLWLYNYLDTQVPSEVILEDASAIIPFADVFLYEKINQFGHGKGSYAGFSDIFRYKLLYEKGGWWTDMDVVCLKPMNFSDEYVFRTHHDYLVVGNVMKCPKGSPLMLDCYNEALLLINKNNTDWNLPIAILNKNIKKHNLQLFIKEISNPDRWLFVRTLLFYNVSQKENWYVIHLMNEEWRKNNINKDAIPAWSLIGKLLVCYNLNINSGNWLLIKNLINIIIPKYNIYYTYKPIIRFFKRFFNK